MARNFNAGPTAQNSYAAHSLKVKLVLLIGETRFYERAPTGYQFHF